MKKISRVEFRMTVDSKERVVIFVRPEKIAELLDAKEPLGEWLRALRDVPEVS